MADTDACISIGCDQSYVLDLRLFTISLTTGKPRMASNKVRSMALAGGGVAILAVGTWTGAQLKSDKLNVPVLVPTNLPYLAGTVFRLCVAMSLPSCLR